MKINHAAPLNTIPAVHPTITTTAQAQPADKRRSMAATAVAVVATGHHHKLPAPHPPTEPHNTISIAEVVGVGQVVRERRIITRAGAVATDGGNQVERRARPAASMATLRLCMMSKNIY
jgi:hypothetical protein